MASQCSFSSKRTNNLRFETSFLNLLNALPFMLSTCASMSAVTCAAFPVDVSSSYAVLEISVIFEVTML